MKEHKYVEHPTYTGPGCAICGRAKFDPVHEYDPEEILPSIY